MTARVRPLPMPDDSSRETEALTLSIVEMGIEVRGADPRRRTRLRRNWRACSRSQEDPLRLAYMIASIMNLDAAKEQALLEAPTRVEGAAHGARLAVA